MRPPSRIRRRALTVVAYGLLTGLTAAVPAGAQQRPIAIPGPLDGPLPRYSGAPATAQPLRGPFPPANPVLAPDGSSGSGLAAGNGAASPLPGPLGHGTKSASALQFGTCASLAFAATGALVATCNGILGPTLRLIDPRTLETLASLMLPPRSSVDRTDLAGGTHFIVRSDGSLLVPTNGRRLTRILVGRTWLHESGAVDLSAVLQSSERPFAVGAGFDGRDWVAGNQGTVVAVPRDGGAPRALALKEPIAEDLATHPTGTYVVTSEALYRLHLRGDSTPRIVWRLPVRSTLADPRSGRIHTGSGTPPVIVHGGYVAVADGLNPPRVTVARLAGRNSRRLACAVPIFRPGTGSVEAHLVAAGRSVVAMNAYGYENLGTTEGGRTSVGGIARVVVGRRGCRVAWTSEQISPSAQPVVSRVTGLLYTLVKPPGMPDSWNLAALDWRTGAMRFTALAGEGLGYNSEGGPLVLAPDGAAFAGTFGGVVRFRDR